MDRGVEDGVMCDAIMFCAGHLLISLFRPRPGSIAEIGGDSARDRDRDKEPSKRRGAAGDGGNQSGIVLFIQLNCRVISRNPPFFQNLF